MSVSKEVQEYRDKIGIPLDHEFVLVESSNRAKHGWDTDIDVYEQRDPCGNVVARYRVTDGTRTYPPFNRNWDFEEVF